MFSTKNINPAITRKDLILSKRPFVLLYAFVLYFLTTGLIHAEGTRQLMPASTDDGYIQIFDLNTLTRPFASFDCPSVNRLNINICNAGEIIYMGFQQNDNDVYFRLKDPTGATVPIPGLIPAAPNTYLLPSAGMGRITSYNRAYNGPAAIAGAGGYNAISYTSTMAGDYYIEFNPVSPTVVTPVKRIFNYFDITVASAANVPINGRVWSQTWDFTTNGGNNQFRAIMHVYSDDGIVTALDFNGMQPFGFTMSCNATGCTNTGNPAADRASRFGNSTYAQYKIFLNDPDPNCYLTGSFGALTQPTTLTGCDDNRCINVSVDKPGNIGILLDLNGIVGYQPGTEDRQLYATVVIGTNCIPWDGRDGFGNLVTSGISFEIQVDYYNGITHLPLYDVEHNPNGYIVTLSRPAGPPPNLFWDDATITTGTATDGLVNLAGCTLPTGCHRWTNRGSNTNPETINTWWYANIISDTITVTSSSITADADTRNPGTGASNDTTVCGVVGPNQLSGGITGAATGGLWETSGSGIFSPNTTTLNATYTPSAADIAASFVYLKITSTGNGTCPAMSDSLRMTFQPAPSVDAGSDQNKCANNASTLLNGSFANAAGVTWTGGNGTFVPNATTANATYTPSAAELTSGLVTLTLSTTGNGVCPVVTDEVDIIISPSPTADAGSDQTACANNATVVLDGATTYASSQNWTGGSGTFNPDNATLNASYTPTPAEIAAGFVLLTLHADSAGCNTVSDPIRITINPSPVVNAGSDQSVCHNNPDVTLNGTVNNTITYSWSGGAGTFTPNNTTLNAVYTPTLTERDNGTVTLTLTATRAGCNPVTDEMDITITPAPVVDAGIDRTICANNQVVNLSGTSTTGSGIWSDGCGIFVPGVHNLNTQYTPCASETAAEAAALVLTSANNGNCAPVTDTILLVITPAPVANAGSDTSVCRNNPSLVLSGSMTNASSGVWSGGAGTFTPSSNALNAQYTFTAAEVASGSVTLTLTATRNTCNPETDQVVITVTPPPTVSAGTDRTVCHNNPDVSLNGVVTIATGGTWSGGAGTFSPDNNTLNAVYTPTLTERNSGSVTLTLTTTGNDNCNAVNDQMTITITPAPTVEAGNPQTVCANNPSLNLNGFVTVASGGSWSGGGTFNPNNSALNAVFTPSVTQIAAGTALLTLTTTGNGNCNPVSDQVTITIIPAPIVNPGTGQTVCADDPAVTLNGSVTTATGGTWSGGTGIFSPDNNTLNAEYTPSIGELNAGSATLILTSTGNGICNPVSDSMTISITPAPSINAGADRTICENVASLPLTGAVTAAGGGVWSTSGSGSFSPNASTLTASYVPSAADRTAGFVTLTLTSTGNGLCHAVSDQLTVTFTALPTINAGPDQIVCANNVPVQLNASGSPATWTGAGNFSPDANSLNAIYTPTAGEIATGTVTLTVSTIASGACPTISDQVTITLPPAPLADAGSDLTMCGNLTGITLNGSVVNATGGFWTTTGTGSFVPNATILNATYRPSTLDKSNGSVQLTLTTTGNGACTGHSDEVTLTIQPAIVVNAGADQNVCGDLASFPLNGTVSNATGGTWSVLSGSGNFTPNNVTLNASYVPSAADITSGTVTLRLSTTGNGVCPVQTDDVVFNIRSAPVPDAGADVTICADVTSIALSGTVTGATGGIWTTSGSGTFSNAASLNTVYFLSADDKAAPSVSFTLTTTGSGVCTPVSDSKTVIINPAPTVDAGTDRTVCADAGTVNLNGSVTEATGGIWTTSGSGVFDDANLLNATYTLSSADSINGSVTLFLTTTGNGLCNAISDQLILTITPVPAVNAGFDQNICASGIVNLNGTVAVATGGTWSSSGTGIFTPNSSSLNASYIPSAADRTTGAITLTLESTGNGTCNTYTDEMILTIQPLPFVNAGSDQTICADSFNVDLSGSVLNAGGGIWTTSGTGNFFPSDTDLNAGYVPSAADRNSGNVTLTLTSTNNGPCNPSSDELTVFITPAPTVNAGSDQVICEDSAFAELNGSFTVANGAVWTSSGTGVFTPDNTSMNAEYIPSANDKLSGSVNITLTTTGNGTCHAVTDNMTITITPAPTVDAGTDQTICSNTPSFNLNANITVASGGIWSTTGTGGFSPGNTSLNANYFFTSADTAAGSVRFILTTTGNGTCRPVADTITVALDALPIVQAGSDQTICASSAGVSLNGSVLNAIGGTWVSDGSGSFAPNNNSLITTYVPSPGDTITGSVLLTLSSTGNGTCPAVTDELLITIEPLPVVSAGPDQVICADAGGVQLSGNILHAPGGTWSSNGTGNFTNSSDLNAMYFTTDADTTAGSIIMTLTSTSAICGSASDNMVVSITPAPTVDAGPDLTVCTGLGVVGINIQGNVTVASGGFWSSSGSGTFSDPNNLNTTYYPTATDEAAGSVVITLITTGNGSCNFYTDDLTLNFAFPIAVISAGNDTTFCTNGFPVQLKGSGTTGRWSGGLGTYTPNDSTLNAKYIPHANEVTNGSVTLTLTAIGMGACTPATDQVIIGLAPGPTANAGVDDTVCTNSGPIPLNGNVTVATSGRWTSSGSGTFADANSLNTTYTPSATDQTTGIVTFTLTTTDNGVCNASTDRKIVRILPGPTIYAGLDQVVCANTDVSLHATFTNAGGMQWIGNGGTFNPDNTSKDAVYTPTALEISSGSITLTAMTTLNGLCPPATDDQIIINFTPAPTADAGDDQTLCSSVSSINLQGSVTVASGGFWSSVGTGTFTTAPHSLQTKYRPSSADTLAGSVILILTTTGNGTCNPVPDSLTITFDPLPIVNAGPNDTICSLDPGVLLNGGITNSTGGSWSTTGSGTFSPDPTDLNASYQQSTQDNLNGSVNILLTSAPNGACPAVSDFVTIKILTSPTALVNAGLDKTVCADVGSVELDGFISMAAGGIWTSTGNGVFSPSDTDLNANYIPSTDDINNGTVTIKLTSSGSGICGAVSDSMVLTITPTPVVTSGSPPNQTICADATSVLLNGTVTDATGGLWSTSGTGYFSPDATDLNATYVPSSLDKANGSVGLTLTSTGHGTCVPVTDDFLVTITPVPTVNAGNDIIVCSHIPTINLNGVVNIASGGTWTSSGSGVFANINSPVTTYDRSDNDTTSHTILLTLTSTGNGDCNAVSDQVRISFESVPFVEAGPDQTLCADNNAIPLNGVVLNTNGLWSTSGSGNFSDVYSLTSTYSPSQLDTANGTVTLTLTTWGNNVCNPLTDQVTLTLQATPIVNAGAAIVCDISDGAVLNGNIVNANSGVWTGSGSGTFSLQPDTLRATYYPSAADAVAGSVTLTLTSVGNGVCPAKSHQTVLAIDPLPVANAGQDEYICRGSETTLTAVTSSNVTYNWSSLSGVPVSTNPTVDITASIDSVFVLTVTDYKGCFTNDTVQINVYDLPDFNLLNHYCLTNSLIIDSDPQNLPAVPGVFQWFRDNSVLTGQDKPVISPLETGTFSISYSYGNCAYSESTDVTRPPVLTHQNSILCENNVIPITIQSNVSGVTYDWSTGESGTDLKSINITVILDTTFYAATVTDDDGCTTSDSVRVIGIPVPQLNLSDSLTVCENTPVILDARPVNIHILNPYNPIFEWHKKPTLLTNTNDSLVVDIPGTYIVDLTVGQCSAKDSTTVNFTPLPVTTLPDNLKFCKETENYIVLDAGFGQGYTYLWSPSSGTMIDSNTTQTIGVRFEDTYAVTITDSLGCEIKDSTFVTDVCPPRLYVPTAFVPNTPGPDGTFKVFGDYFINYQMTIFNRWGEIIFISKDRNESWDGTYRGIPMPIGVYPWVVTYEGEDPDLRGPYRKEGSVTVIR